MGELLKQLKRDFCTSYNTKGDLFLNKELEKLKQLKTKRNELSKQFGIALENHDITEVITAMIKQDNLFDEIIKTYDSMIEKGN